MKIYSYDKKGNPEFWGIGDFNYGYQEIDKSTLLQQGYCMNAYVYMLSNRIAEKVPSLPYKFVNREGEEVETQEVESFIELIEQGEGMKVLLEKLAANLVALGEFFVAMIEPIGFEGTTSKLEVISPACVTIQTVNGHTWGDIKSFLVSDYYTGEIPNDNMIFGKYPNIKSHTNRGLSPFEPLWDVVQASNNAFQAHGQIIRNMGANGIISPKNSNSVEALPLQDDERNFLQKAVDKLLGSFSTKNKPFNADNFGKSIISSVGVDYTQLGFDPQKLQILDMNQDNLKVMAAAVNLDSKLFNDDAASTYNNQTTAEKAAYLNCYIPTANYIFKVLSCALLPDEITWCVDEERIEILNERDQSREKETREGIISIQNQVADGKISVMAGVATLETVYGYDEQKALSLLDIPEREVQTIEAITEEQNGED